MQHGWLHPLRRVRPICKLNYSTKSVDWSIGRYGFQLPWEQSWSDSKWSLVSNGEGTMFHRKGKRGKKAEEFWQIGRNILCLLTESGFLGDFSMFFLLVDYLRMPDLFLQPALLERKEAVVWLPPVGSETVTAVLWAMRWKARGFQKARVVAPLDPNANLHIPQPPDQKNVAEVLYSLVARGHYLMLSQTIAPHCLLWQAGCFLNSSCRFLLSLVVSHSSQIRPLKKQANLLH